MALADQAKGIHHGFANPLLIRWRGAPRSATSSIPFADGGGPHGWANFLNPHQGQLFTLRSLNQTGTLHTTPGYDGTGLGSPNGQAFLDAMS